MARHRQRSDWPLTLGIMLLAAVLSGLVVLLLHHQRGVADRALDVGVRPVGPTPEITYTGPITTGPTPTPPPDPGR
ncbi:MAG TPA: hypothetical protein VIP28_15260 [Nocardioides sp.]